MPDKCLEELPFGRREVHLRRGLAVVAVGTGWRRLVDHMIAEVNGPPPNLNGFHHLWLGHASSDSSNSCQELRNAERLRDIVIRAGTECVHLGGAVHPPGE